MKVIICGAGLVGFNIARYLASENNDVTVVDQSPDLIRKIVDSLDVQGVCGHASHPDVLERAGADNADMLIAVTHMDETNMVACQVAHSLFDVPTKIARIRAQSYLQPLWLKLFSRDHLPIDVIISPEIEVARAIQRRLHVPGAFDVIPLADGKVQLVGVHCTEDTPVVNTPLRQLTVLFPDLSIVIVGIVRNGKSMVPSADDQILAGDDVYLVVDASQTRRALAAFGHEETEARRILILGGGNVGLFLAEALEKAGSGVTAKLIERNPERADLVAKSLKHTTVLKGDVLEAELLEEAGVDQVETVVAVTNDDETNILASLMAKRYGGKRAIALINNLNYDALVGPLGVDVTVNPRSLTVSNILQHVRRGRIHAVHSVREGFGEIIEADALETSDLVGSPLKEIKLPSGVLVGAVVRDGTVISPRGNTVIHTNDRVVMFAVKESVKKVEKMFSSAPGVFLDNVEDRLRQRPIPALFPSQRACRGPGYQFADGVYEVIAVLDGALVDLEPHLDRLDRSLESLRINRPMTRRALTAVIKETVRQNRVRDGKVYLQITRGVARREFHFPTDPVRPALVVMAIPCRRRAAWRSRAGR